MNFIYLARLQKNVFHLSVRLRIRLVERTLTHQVSRTLSETEDHFPAFVVKTEWKQESVRVYKKKVFGVAFHNWGNDM